MLPFIHPVHPCAHAQHAIPPFHALLPPSSIQFPPARCLPLPASPRWPQSHPKLIRPATQATPPFLCAMLVLPVSLLHAASSSSSVPLPSLICHSSVTPPTSLSPTPSCSAQQHYIFSDSARCFPPPPPSSSRVPPRRPQAHPKLLRPGMLANGTYLLTPKEILPARCFPPPSPPLPPPPASLPAAISPSTSCSAQAC
ncbi:unnamed protein product [Closterium sp. NIES-53]